MITAIILALVGLGFVLAEVFFPSLGVFGIIAGACIIMANVLAFEEGDAAGYTFMVASVVLVPLVVRWGFQVLPKLPFGKRMILSAPVGDPGGGLPDLAHLEGRTGTALTDLRPGGMARIDGERLSVVSLDGMLDKGTPLLVTGIEGAEVRVRSRKTPA
ncbi:MAG: NfeD family protein [Planctomycetota bacterium]|nr:NfeD family protein [Planctomycetota bacterium]